MLMLYKWVGPFGTYDVPQAILWLANTANKRNGFPEVTQDWSMEMFKLLSGSPGWKVVEEWGAWRDEQARIAYEAGQGEWANEQVR